MKRYILGAHPDKQCAMIQAFDDSGVLGGWREFNAGIVYLASDVEERIAKLEKALREIVRTAATIPGSVCGGDLHPVVAQYLVSARSVESARSLLGL